MNKSNTNQYSGLFFKVGLVASMGLALVAFEWKTPTDNRLKVWNESESKIYESPQLPPITVQEISKPKPKTMQKPIERIDKIEIVDNSTEVKEVFKSVDFIENEAITPIVDVIEIVEVEEKANVIWEIVEEKAEPKGFYEFVRKNLKYPRQAKRMGIEGKVIMQFVVNKDGSIVDAKVLRGIGGGCDEEALRIIQNSPKWKPGKQRGNEVRQRMTFPLIFRLN